jgi:hypothetical protein
MTTLPENRQLIILLLALTCLALSLAGPQAARGTEISTRAAPIQVSNAQVLDGPPWDLFLPLVATPPTGIMGRVTKNGAPAAEVRLRVLKPFSSGGSMEIASTTTDADGRYVFTDVPSLSAGEEYYVHFFNIESLADRLTFWRTTSITSYTQGQSVEMGEFDIANAALVSPPNGMVALPATFQWNVRPASPGDSYQVKLLQYGGASFESLMLGYVNTYELTSLPPTLSTNVEIRYYVWVYSPDGGSGASNFYVITFSDLGTEISPGLATALPRSPDDYETEHIRQVGPLP